MNQHRRQAGNKTALQDATREIVHVAAKILAEEGVNDYLLAKQRALKRLHLPVNTALPSNTEVQQSLASHLELFDRQGLLKRQLEYRRLAIQLMEILEAFQPLAVGVLVDGIVTKTSRLELHVFAPTVEDITIALINENIPYTLTEQQVRFVQGETDIRPAFEFMLGDTPISLCVFGEGERRKSPLSTIDGRPLKRITANGLENYPQQP